MERLSYVLFQLSEVFEVERFFVLFPAVGSVWKRKDSCIVSAVGRVFEVERFFVLFQLSVSV